MLGAIAFCTTIISANCLAEVTKGALLKTGDIVIDVRKPTMQSVGSPIINPGEYVAISYSGIMRYEQGDQLCNAMNASCDFAASHVHIPLFDMSVPGHPLKTIKAARGNIYFLSKNQGTISTRLYDSSHNNNQSVAIANIKVYEACFKQDIRLSTSHQGEIYFHTDLNGQWCSGQAQVTSAQAAEVILTTTSTNLVYQGITSTSEQWWHNKVERKRHTTIMPRFNAKNCDSLPKKWLTKNQWQPVINVDYHNNGKFRVRITTDQQTKSSPWYAVTDSKKLVHLTI